MKPLYSDGDYLRLGGKVSYSVENEIYYRGEFSRDRARLIHSPAFRRLRGKTQLFPNTNNDFFRCRLTHSLEVATIAKTITRKLNWQLEKIYSEKFPGISMSKDYYINEDLVEFSCLAHDIGHPPFGHQGEQALNAKMAKYGGFEGNAQTLRILAILEKKELDHQGGDTEIDYSGISDKGDDLRYGLNLTSRALASIIKYNEEIPANSENLDPNKVAKGYYYHDRDIVNSITKNVGFEPGDKQTIECQIMDIADDIAYSTYDLEDAFKGGFNHPLELWSLNPEFYVKVVEEVNSSHVCKRRNISITKEDIIDTITEYVYLPDFTGIIEEGSVKDVSRRALYDFSPKVWKASIEFADIGYLRNRFTSAAISSFIDQISIDYNEERPTFSTLRVEDETIKHIEILKKVTFLSQIESTKLKIVEYRGKNLLSELFDIFISDSNKNGILLVDDVKRVYNKVQNENYKMRVICDFIASMTNRYAIDYIDRLKSITTSKSIFSYLS